MPTYVVTLKTQVRINAKNKDQAEERASEIIVTHTKPISSTRWQIDDDDAPPVEYDVEEVAP